MRLYFVNKTVSEVTPDGWFMEYSSGFDCDPLIIRIRNPAKNPSITRMNYIQRNTNR